MLKKSTGGCIIKVEKLLELIGGYQLREDFDKEAVQKMLKAMSFTGLDLIGDFKEAISRTSQNGLSQAVWAKRSDILENQFKDDEHMEVLHIPRSSLWQIDPVLNLKTGVLYLFFSEKNLEKVQKDYTKKGLTTHYAYIFLQRSLSKKIMGGSNMELIPLEKSDESTKKRNEKIVKMLGDFSNKCKDIIFISVSYFDNMAIAASVNKYTSEFLLSEKHDVSDMLSISYKGDSTPNMHNKDIADEKTALVTPLVTLKHISKTAD